MEKIIRLSTKTYEAADLLKYSSKKADDVADGLKGAKKGGSDSVPKSLRKGKANTSVYYGIKDGKKDYVGITNNISRRHTQPGDRFDRLIEI